MHNLEAENEAQTGVTPDTLNPKTLAAIAKLIFSLDEEEILDCLNRLELSTEGSIFDQMSRLSQNLLYEYTAEDFLNNDEIEENSIEDHRKNLISQALKQFVKTVSAKDKNRRNTMFTTPSTLTNQQSNNTPPPNAPLTSNTPQHTPCLYIRATLEDGTVLNLPSAVVEYSRQLNIAQIQPPTTSTVTSIPALNSRTHINESINSHLNSVHRYSRGGGNHPNSHPSIPSHNTPNYRSKDVGETVRKWNIKFSGDKSTSIEEFLSEIERRAHLSQMSDDELLLAIPEALTGIATLWYKSMGKYWFCWGDFCQAARKHFGAGQDFQQSLEAEIVSRTQGPDEPAHSYIFSQLALAEKLNPPMDMTKKLRILYKNLKPEMKSFIWKTNFTNEEDFITHALNAERIIQSNSQYKPPPPPEMSLLPEMAYKPSKQKSKSAASQNINNLAIEVAAILQESSIGWRQLKTGKDAKGKRSSDSSDSDTSEFERKNYYRKRRPKQFKQNQYQQNNQEQDSPRTDNFNKKQQTQTSNNNNTKNQQSTSTSDNRQKGNSQSLPRTPCPSCKKPGHWRKDCPEKQELKCWTCDEPGVTKKNCPKCNLNREGEA